MTTFILIVLGIIAYLTIARVIVIWYDNKYQILNDSSSSTHGFELGMCTFFFPIFVIWQAVRQLTSLIIKSKWNE